MTSIVDSEGGSGMIRSDRRGRVLIGAAQREALLDEFDRSGLSAMAFCRLHGLVYPTFATWVQKRRRRPAATPAFAEVVVESRDEAPAVAPNGLLRVTLTGGVTLEMSGCEQLPLVVELIRQLSVPC